MKASSPCLLRRVAAYGCVAVLVGSASARAADFDDYCKVEGAAPALRQTLVIVDEHHIATEADKKMTPANQPWRRFVLELTDVRRTGIARDFVARERVTLFVARRDGGGLTRLFSGCLPLFSEDERKAAAQSQSAVSSAVSSFFGRGADARIKKDADRFASLVNSSMIEIARPERASQANTSRDLLKSGLVASLARSRVVELSQGIPRLFIYSDMTRFEFPGVSDTDGPAARELGASLGQKAQLDLERSEVYVVSAGTAGSPDVAREVLHSFFLQSRARLMSFSGTPTIPNVAANPVSLVIYQGKIAFPRGAYPMRMRLAVDRNGTAVNSWISVQTDIERYTPLGGVLTCGSGANASCKFIGDRVLAQIWSRVPRQEPKFEAWMPFSGAREVEFDARDDRVTGAVFDSAVDFKDVKDNKLRFELTRLTGGAY